MQKIKLLSVHYSKVVDFITPDQILTSLVTHKTWSGLGTVSLTIWFTHSSSLLKASKYFICSLSIQTRLSGFQ